jgi:hypothetical protein
VILTSLASALQQRLKRAASTPKMTNSFHTICETSNTRKIDLNRNYDAEIRDLFAVLPSIHC